ncbi:hypothetical protein KHU1_1566 [Bacillus amyloliquefaciens KHG19]|nr:hypothetical protein KHU1_1566 [Bacillus amyloliquefaciens KHG19]BBA76340.1 hypothetical protein BVS141_18160 [Bacillus velezensis]CDG25998.1 protein of unknown function [Bacillus velezensis UCMB5113]CDG29693.1 protein of unknown function [Bacillus velezensis UCMB5033]
MWGNNLPFVEKTLLKAGFFVFKLNTSLGYRSYQWIMELKKVLRLVTIKKIKLEGWEKHKIRYSNVVKLERG